VVLWTEHTAAAVADGAETRSLSISLSLSLVLYQALFHFQEPLLLCKIHICFTFDFTKIRTAYEFEVRRTSKTKLHGLSPRANYTDRAAAAGRRS
jgi:hypothetical protein